MKKITLLFCLLAVSFGYSQQVVLEDFEGAAPSTELFDGFTSATVVANPTNAAENSLELITAAAGQAWQGAKLVVQNTTIDMTTTDKTMSVDIYSTTARDFLVKLTDGDIGGADNAQESKTAASHTGSGWETLTLDFNIGADTGQPGYNPPNDKFAGIVFFPLFIAPDNGWNPAAMTTTYIDNVTGISGGIAETCNDGVQNNGETGVDCGGPNCAACPAAPTVAAPAPPARSPQNVISIFSDAYTDISVDTFDTSWCPGTTTEVMVAGNATKVVTGLGCEGVEFVTGRFNATDFGFFHIDIWTDSPTTDKSFNMKFSDWDGTGGEVSAIEFSTTNASTPALPSTNPGTWISLEIPLTSWSAGSRADLVQFIITSDLGTVYYDNLYLHNNNLSTDDFASAQFKAFPNPTNGNWNISSSTIINKVSVYDILGKQVVSFAPNANEVVIDASSLTSGIYFARIEGIKGSKTVKLIKE